MGGGAWIEGVGLTGGAGLMGKGKTGRGGAYGVGPNWEGWSFMEGAGVKGKGLTGRGRGFGGVSKGAWPKQFCPKGVGLMGGAGGRGGACCWGCGLWGPTHPVVKWMEMEMGGLGWGHGLGVWLLGRGEGHVPRLPLPPQACPMRGSRRC